MTRAPWPTAVFGRAARARAARHRWDDDRGTSLTELLVGMGIMTVFMSIFLAAILMMTSTANKVDSTTISATQTNLAFLRLDKLVRYAGAISTPGVSTTPGSSGDWYVEMDVPPATVGAADTCTQLRIDSGQLQQRAWTMTGSIAGTASSWTPIASYVTNGAALPGSSDVPFSAPTSSAAASTTFQRLQLTLVSTAGATATSTNRAQMTFTALNSDASLASNATTCQQAGRP